MVLAVSLTLIMRDLTTCRKTQMISYFWNYKLSLSKIENVHMPSFEANDPIKIEKRESRNVKFLFWH